MCVAAVSGRPFFSIVIATRNNAGRTLGRAIESVRAQTLQDLEVVIVDDGSTDGVSLPVLLSLARELSETLRINVLTQPNGGPGAARNHGVNEACGDFVVFLDDDDEWHPDKLATLKQVIDAERPDFVYTGMEILNAQGRVLSTRVPVAPVHLPEAVQYQCPAVPSVMAFRKAYFERVGGFLTDLMGFEDWALVATVARDLVEGRAQVSVIPLPHTRYYQLPNAMSAGSAWRTLLAKESQLNRKRGLLDYRLSGMPWLKWWLRRNSDTLYTHGIGARDAGSPWVGFGLIGASLCLGPLRTAGYKALAVTVLRLAGLRWQWSDAAPSPVTSRSHRMIGDHGQSMGK